MTEAQLQNAVIGAARFFGWRVAHFRPAKTAQGWRTPVQADGAGYPDLTLVRRERLIFAELKSARGTLRPDQVAWTMALAEVPGVELYVWRPALWLDGTIEQALR